MRMRQLLMKGLAGLLFIPALAQAVVFYSTGDTNYNTTAPVGALADSGWQFQGKIGSFSGTAIAPHHFVSAKHFSKYMAVGTPIYYQDDVFTTISRVDDPDSDLSLWEIDGTFPSYAPLFAGDFSVGQGFAVFGRGRDRGDVVTVDGEVRGWKWGANNKIMRWGTNTVSGLADYAVNGDKGLVIAAFNNGAGTNECMLSSGDSGGGLFVKDNGIWKLAGVNYSVGPVQFDHDIGGSNKFEATMFDYSRSMANTYDFYYSTTYPAWTPASAFVQGGKEVPCQFYATSIPAFYDWVTNNIPDFDQDVDGLPDWWESLYSPGSTNLIAAVDLDDDGFSNYMEWMADTVPTNGASYFQVTDWAGGTNVTFTSSSNRQYQIEFKTNLLSVADWAVETAWFTGLVAQTTQPISTDSTNRFLRIQVKVR